MKMCSEWVRCKDNSIFWFLNDSSNGRTLSSGPGTIWQGNEFQTRNELKWSIIIINNHPQTDGQTLPGAVGTCSLFKAVRLSPSYSFFDRLSSCCGRGGRCGRGRRVAHLTLRSGHSWMKRHSSHRRIIPLIVWPSTNHFAPSPSLVRFLLRLGRVWSQSKFN